jgi:Fungal specific transcription factor domain
VLPSGAAPFLPDDLVRSLIALFFRHVAPTFPVLDRRKFEDAFNRRLHRESGQHEALVLLVCAIGSTYSNDPRIASNSGNTPGDGWRYFLHGRDWLQCLTPATLPELQILTVRGQTPDRVASCGDLIHLHSIWTAHCVLHEVSLTSAFRLDRSRCRHAASSRCRVPS